MGDPRRHAAPLGYASDLGLQREQTDPAGELHTNFALNKSGEFLGLFNADRIAVHTYSPSFPPQYENIAYGVAISLADDTCLLVSNTSPVRAYCPADDALGTTWRTQAFDDTEWLAGLLPTGYGTKNPAWVSEVNLSLLEIARDSPRLPAHSVRTGRRLRLSRAHRDL